MHPDLFRWQGLALHTWGLMVMLAFTAACLVLSFRVKRVGIDSDKLVPLYLIVIVAGMLGARLLHFTMAEPAHFFSRPLDFFDPSQGGFAFYGGAIGGILSGVLWAKVQRIPVWKLADAAAPCIMLGLSIGRLGCFSAGCCHGSVAASSWSSTLAVFDGGSIVTVRGYPWIALVFKRGVGVGSIFDKPLYPTQLWESAGAMALFLYLSWVWKHGRRFDGQVLAMMLVLYAGMRSAIEVFRGDTIRGVGYFGLLSTSQVVSIFMVLAAIAIAVVRWPKGVAPESPFEPEEIPS